MSESITRDAFLYFDPKSPKDKFAQCATCMMFTENKCTIHGPNIFISPQSSCGLYVHGKPDSTMPVMKVVTPMESGLVTRQVRCENCLYFNKENSTCHLYDILNTTLDNMFTCNIHVHPQGCCNAQTPKD